MEKEEKDIQNEEIKEKNKKSGWDDRAKKANWSSKSSNWWDRR